MKPRSRLRSNPETSVVFCKIVVAWNRNEPRGRKQRICKPLCNANLMLGATETWTVKAKDVIWCVRTLTHPETRRTKRNTKTTSSWKLSNFPRPSAWRTDLGPETSLVTPQSRSCAHHGADSRPFFFKHESAT